MRLEFSRKTKRERYAFAKGCCEYCGIDFERIKQTPEYHHALECREGGDSSFENCRCICKRCHARATAAATKRQAKGNRLRDREIGATSARRTIQSRGFQKTPPQRTASTPPVKIVPRRQTP
jgi:5-methylcytosine-specific restriction endonuclease McrA